MILDEISDTLTDLNDVVKANNIGINVWLECNRHYNIHKSKTGSYKHLLRRKDDLYFDKMMERLDYVFCKINEYIEDIMYRKMMVKNEP